MNSNLILFKCLYYRWNKILKARILLNRGGPKLIQNIKNPSVYLCLVKKNSCCWISGKLDRGEIFCYTSKESIEVFFHYYQTGFLRVSEAITTSLIPLETNFPEKLHCAD